MIYRLKELKGDTIAVPQLVFSKLGIAEEYNVRVALYVLATGITDPDTLFFFSSIVYSLVLVLLLCRAISTDIIRFRSMRNCFLQ